MRQRADACDLRAGAVGRGPIDSCISQLKAQGPSRTCNESKEEEEEVHALAQRCTMEMQQEMQLG